MQATLVKKEHLADDIQSFWFRPSQRIRYDAGQFIGLTLPQTDRLNNDQRWFTLSSSPSEELIAITTKIHEKSSPYKQALVNLKPGDNVTISQPMGDFVLPKDSTIPLVFVAIGVGITPVRSILTWLKHTRERRTIQVVYAARKQSDLVFLDTLTSAASNLTLVLSQPHKKWSGYSGKLDATKLSELSDNRPNTVFFISGPEEITKDLTHNLQRNGVEKYRIVADHFPGYHTE
ncbi:MAG: FAD-dependent oxidoreductase [Candidatus Saccharibacteria bacterium]|nr:FAD-dependent oxidoreductase [Candidatus Saccharibacteria bacterium]